MVGCPFLELRHHDSAIPPRESEKRIKFLACGWRENRVECAIEGGNTLSECDLVVEEQLDDMQGSLAGRLPSPYVKYATKLLARSTPVTPCEKT